MGRKGNKDGREKGNVGRKDEVERERKSGDETGMVEEARGRKESGRRK